MYLRRERADERANVVEPNFALSFHSVHLSQIAQRVVSGTGNTGLDVQSAAIEALPVTHRGVGEGVSERAHVCAFSNVSFEHVPSGLRRRRGGPRGS